jgi:acyl-CoA synthetase (AMP-forming)/AMP-acid ligase II
VTVVGLERAARRGRVGDVLEDRARSCPDALAMTDLRGARVTFAELDAASSALSARLAATGAARDPVVVGMPNSMAAALAIWAVLKSGHPLAVLHPGLPEEPRRRLLAALAPAAVVRPGPGAGLDDVVIEARPPARRPPDGAPDVLPTALRPALLICTSGTVGRPKTIVCPGEQVRWATSSISRMLGYRPSDVVACVPPFSFDYGLYQLLLAAAAGSAVLVDPRLDSVQGVAAAIGRGALTVLPVVPPFLRQLCGSRLLERAPAGSVRMVTTTGDFLHDRDIEQAARAFPGCRMVPMFGLSECKRVAITPDGDERPPGAVGMPLVTSAVAIVDSDLVPMAPGAVGELVVAGSHLTHGYRANPEATRGAFAVDPDSGLRLLRTGDLLARDAGGWLFWHGRNADLIKTSGFRISCSEIERAVGSVPAVAEVGVFGRPDGQRGQVAVAVVRLLEGVTEDEGRRQVEAATATALPRWAVPQVELTAEVLPRTRHGKLDRSRLAAARGARAPGAADGPEGSPPPARPVRLLRPDAARRVPVSRRFIACHTQAFLSAFRLPQRVSSDEFELLTSVPFGCRHVPGDMNRCVVPYLDPDVGLDRAAALLGVDLEYTHEDSPGAAEAAFDRLDRWLLTGPVVLGPLDIGDLRYLPYAGALAGCDHYVVALGTLEDGYLLRDPEGYVQVALPRRDLERSWAKVAVPEGRGPFAMRRVLHRGAGRVPAAADLRAAAARNATANLVAADGAPHGGRAAWDDLAGLARTPSAQRSLSFLLPATGYRAHLGSLLFASLTGQGGGGPRQRRSAARIAALLERQVATLGDMTGTLHRTGWVEAAQLEAMADLERQLATEAGAWREAAR